MMSYRIATIPVLLLTISLSAQQKQNDRELITKTIENYFYGYIERDGTKLEKAFDQENGAMKFARKTEEGKELITNIPFSELVRKWSSREKMPESDLKNCTLKILNIDAVGDQIASAKISMKVVETTYIDILSLYKFNGTWKIVNKVYVIENKD